MAEYLLPPESTIDELTLHRLVWGRIRHDASGNLASIIGNAWGGLAHPGDDPGKTAHRFRVIDINAMHLQHVLFGLSALAAGSGAREQFSAETVLEDLRSYARIKHPDVEVVVDSQKEEIYGLKAPLYTQLFNFFTNARRASEPPYEVGLSAARIDLSSEHHATLCPQASAIYRPGDPFMRFSVKDHGKGIPEERLAAIFMPGVTYESASGGTGLGLALAVRTCETLHGVIHVESEVGKGSTFSISIPRYMKR